MKELIESRECPCCGREDTTEEVFDGAWLPCGCPCFWSVDAEQAYIEWSDDVCHVCKPNSE